MAKTIILFALAIVVAILLGFNIGRKKGYIEGWNKGHEFANKFWEQHLPKEVYNSVMYPCLEKLMNLIFSDNFDKDEE